MGIRLVGGCLHYLTDRPVVALAYQWRKSLINGFT